MRVNALAESGDWGELEKLSKTKKPPIGMEVQLSSADLSSAYLQME